MLYLIRNMSEVKNYEMNLRRALNKKQPKESQVKKAAEAMFGPLGKTEKPENKDCKVLQQKNLLMKKVS